MIHFYATLKAELDAYEALLDARELPILQRQELIYNFVTERYLELRAFARHYVFMDEAEEILYFKELKPAILSRVIYGKKFMELERTMPHGRPQDQRHFIGEALSRMHYFFNHNRDFIRYYRSGSTTLDSLFFLRRPDFAQGLPDSMSLEIDYTQSTGFDLKVAKLLAHDQLQQYLLSAYVLTQVNDPAPTSFVPPAPELFLPNPGISKAELESLLELFYARISDTLAERLVHAPTPEADHKLLKSDQVQRMLKISPNTLYKLRMSGTLPYTKIGRVLFYREADVLQMLSKHRK